MRIAGVILLIIGVIGLLLGDISFVTDTETMVIEGIDVSFEQRRRLPVRLPAIVAIIAGVALLGLGMRRPLSGNEQ